MKKKYLLGLSGIVLIVVATLMIQVYAVHSQPPLLTPTPSGLVTLAPNTIISTPTPLKVTDLAPNVATVDKATIIVQHPDGTRESFLLSVQMIDSILSRLPAGDKIDSIIPPQSLMGHHPLPTVPPLGNESYWGTPGIIIGTPPSSP